MRQHRRQHLRPHHPRPLQHRLIRCLPVNRQKPVLPRLRDPLRRLVQHHKRHRPLPQLMRQHPPNPSIPADDRVVLQFLDVVLHAFTSQNSLNLRLRQPLHERTRHKNDPRAPEKNQPHRPQPQPRTINRHHLPKPHAKRRDHHHVKRIRPRPPRNPIPHRKHQHHHQHKASRPQQVALGATKRLWHTVVSLPQFS